MKRSPEHAARRGVLKRGATVLAGVLGLGVAAKGASAANGPSAGVEQTTFYGRGWQLRTPGRRTGEAPYAGERATGHGELLDEPDGRKIGEFVSSYQSVESPFGPGPFAVDGLEQHTFRLTDGTLFGLGTSTADEGSFAIVGGTGRYAGARGSYLSRQLPRELGGDDSAVFTLTLLP